MATYHERNESRNKGVDAYNQRTASREFYADLREPSAAVALVVASEGGINSPYPGDGGLVVDNITTSAAPDGIGTFVNYAYSTDRRFTAPTTTDRDKLGYYTWSQSYVTKTTHVPFARKVRRKVASGSSVLDVDVWEIGEGESVPECELAVQINITRSEWTESDTGTVAAQVGALHLINGLYYLFDGASVSRRGEAIYDVTYNYRLDSETKWRASVDPNFKRPGMDRPRWYGYTVRPSDDPTTTPPTFAVEPNWYRVDNTGAQSLPGWPL